LLALFSKNSKMLGVNPSDREELNELVSAQVKLRLELMRLEERIEKLHSRVGAPGERALPTTGIPEMPKPVAASVVSPPREGASESASPPKLPPSLPVRDIFSTEEKPSVFAQASLPKTPPLREQPPIREADERASSSLEVQLGRVWFVRLGIVLLLTGLVFLGNYAWQNFVVNFGPAGKLALFILGGLGLCGAGATVERRFAGMKNWGRVVLAGGLALLYYCAYAAYYVPGLKVIDSALLAGVLLLAGAGGIVWTAHRRDSELLGGMGVVLSFYTAAINPVAGWTMFSNLVLAVAAVWFLVRKKWFWISTLSLLLCYGSFAWWRIMEVMPGAGRGIFSNLHLGSALGYLAAYWVLFGFAGWFAREEKFARWPRAGFLTLNNALCFLFGALLIALHRSWDFWLFCLVFAGLVAVLGLLVRRRWPDDEATESALVAQSLLLASVGVALKLAGWQEALVFALASAVMIVVQPGRMRMLFTVFSGAMGTWACLLAGGPMLWSGSEAKPLGVGLPIMLLMAFCARWSKRGEENATTISAAAVFYSTLFILLGMTVIHAAVPPFWFGPTLLFAAVILVWSSALHGLRELSGLALVWLVVSWITWLSQRNGTPPPWLSFIEWAGTLAVARWWKTIGVQAVNVALRVAAMGILSAWVWFDVALEFRAPIYVVLGIAFLALALWEKERLRCWFSAAQAGWGVLIYWVANWPTHRLCMAIPMVVCLVIEPLLVRWRGVKLTEKQQLAGNVVAVVAWATLLRLASSKVLEWGGGFYLTVAWALIAGVCFAGGLWLQLRHWRWCGLGMLGLALGRVVFVDVWALGTLGRIISFMVLGAVLMAVGFLYNKFAERLKALI